METLQCPTRDLGLYALFMACNELGTRYGRHVSGFHLELYRITNEHARRDGVTIMTERMDWDTQQRAQVRRHFIQHALEWETYLTAVQDIYYSGASEHIQTQFKFMEA